jgi:hypothetical protein
MKGCIGQTDQIIRGIFGTALIMIAGLGAVHGPWQALLLVLGALGVFTAAAGFCPLYRLLGTTTYRA